MFQTTHYEWQIIGFFMIFVLEGVATYWSFLEGTAITAILVSIFVDIVLAIVAHIWHREICRLKNENVFTEAVRNTANEQKITRLKIVTYFFYLLILCSAFFKCFWFYSVYQIFDSKALFIFTCYILGAILHITCTGYAFYTFIFKIRIGKEHNAYINSDGKKYFFDKENPLSGLIDSKIDLNLAQAGRHRIVVECPNQDCRKPLKSEDLKNQKCSKCGHDLSGYKKKYYFHTYEILTDKELRDFISQQKDTEQRRTVATEGVKHQYTIWQK